MAKVVEAIGMNHLRGPADMTLCGHTVTQDEVMDGELECPQCAALALKAIETSTKSERRDWRRL
jgi:hypothetical protein